MQDPLNLSTENKKTCVNCGAELKYAPGTTSLTCDYCGYSQEIPVIENNFLELELTKYLNEMGGQSHSEEITMIQCKNCGANQHIEENYKSLHCIYCSTPLIIEDAYKTEWILPGALVPFKLTQKQAYAIFKKWVNSLWFAPNDLKKAAINPQFTKGLYLPYWTFDANLFASYVGQRGDYYYVSVPYTTTVNGKTVTRSRQERRTRWTPVSGHINGFVDDTLIKASKQKSGRIPPKIENWSLTELKPFNSSFLAGFVTEKYTIPLKDGHLDAEQEANKIAHRWAKKDIGGDTQRISSLNMELKDETFKHILVPVYISAYKYKNRRFNFFVNGQTGVLYGDRPYSFWKIFFLILFIIIVILLILFLIN